MGEAVTGRAMVGAAIGAVVAGGGTVLVVMAAMWIEKRTTQDQRDTIKGVLALVLMAAIGAFVGCMEAEQ